MEMVLRRHSILSTLAISLVGNLLNALLKIAYGTAFGSLAFLADGIHSLFDSTSTVIGMASIIMSTKPPDDEHPYGHQKFETLSAIALGLLLLLAAYEVGTMAFHRFFNPARQPVFSLWGFTVLGFTMLINLSTAYMERKRSVQLASNFLAADALHNQSDFLISCAVLATVVSAHFQVPYIDPLASLLITFYLVYLAVRLILFNIQPLLDRSVLDPLAVERIVNAVDGVAHCHHIRSRGEKDHHFLDLNIHLPGHITLARAHEITHEVERKLKGAFPGLVDVVIHTEPHGHEPCAC